jgi:hypothetical protein
MPNAWCISVNLGNSTLFKSEDYRTALLLGHASGRIRRLFLRHMVWYNFKCAPERVNSQLRHTEKCKWLRIECQLPLNRSWKIISHNLKAKSFQNLFCIHIYSAETEYLQILNSFFLLSAMVRKFCTKWILKWTSLPFHCSHFFILSDESNKTRSRERSKWQATYGFWHVVLSKWHLANDK